MDETLRRSLEKRKASHCSHLERCSPRPAPRSFQSSSHKETTHAIHVHPCSPGCLHGDCRMLHLTPTCLTCAQNSTQDKTPAWEDLHSIPSLSPKLKAGGPPSTSDLQMCLAGPTQGHPAPRFKKYLNLFPTFKNCDVFTFKLGPILIRP